MITRKFWLITLTFLLCLLGNPYFARSQTNYPVITSENASQLRQVAQFGRGKLIDADWTADGKTLVVTSTLGVWLYDGTDLDKQPRFLGDPKEPMQTMASRGENGRIAASTGSTLNLWNADGTNPLSVQVSKDIANNQIYSMAFSPDGAVLATGEYFNVELRDGSTGEVKKTLTANRSGGSGSMESTSLGEVNAVAFSPDGQYLAAAGAWVTHDDMRVGGPIVVWDLRTGKQISTFDMGRRPTLTSLAFSPDGKWLYWSDWTNQSSRTEIQTGNSSDLEDYHHRPVTDIAVSPDGKTVANASDDGTIGLWETASNFAKITLHGHPSRVDKVAYSPDSKLLVSVGNEGTVRVWNVLTGQSVHVLSGFTDTFEQMQVSPDGQWIAAGGYNGVLYVWQPLGDKTLMYAQVGDYGLNSITFSPDGHFLAWTDCAAVNNDPSLCRSAHVYLWEPHSVPEKVILLTSLISNFSEDAIIAFSPDSKTLAIGSADGAINLWDVATGKITSTLSGHTKGISALAFSQDGKLLASSDSNDYKVLIHDLATGKVVNSFVENNVVTQLFFTPDASLLAAHEQDYSVQVWPLKTNQHPLTIKSLSSVFAQNNDGTVLATGDYDGNIFLWSTKTGALQTLPGTKEADWRLGFSSDGKLLAAGKHLWYADDNSSVELWDIASGKQIASLPGSIMPISGVAFSPDGRWLVSAGEDGTVRLWAVGAGVSYSIGVESLVSG